MEIRHPDQRDIKDEENQKLFSHILNPGIIPHFQATNTRLETKRMACDRPFRPIDTNLPIVLSIPVPNETIVKKRRWKMNIRDKVSVMAFRKKKEEGPIVSSRNRPI